MTYNIPQHYEPQIHEVAQAQHISETEVLERIFKAGFEQFAGESSNIKTASRRSYASFFGVANGRAGAHGSREAVYRYIAELRNEW
jgi:hypothetical protein